MNLALVTTGGLVLFVAVVTTITAAYLMQRARAAGAAHAAAMASYLGIPRHRLPRAGGRVEIDIVGGPLGCRCRPGDRSRSSHYVLGLPAAHAVELEVRTERQAERVGKQLGLVREVQTGDAAFDERCFIDTAQIDFARRYLAEPARREHLLAVLDGGFDAVRFDGDGVSAVVYEPGLARPDAGRLPATALVTALRALADGLPRGGALLEQSRAWRRRLAVVYTPLVLLAAAGLCGAAFAAPRFLVLDGFAFLRFTLLLTVPATAVLGAVVIAALRGHAASLRHCFIALLLVATACLVGGWAGALSMNATLDGATPEAHVVPVTGRREQRRDRGQSTYLVRVASWRPGRTHEEFVVRSAVYRALNPGRDAMRIVTGAGRFGFEWYLSRDLELGAESPGRRAAPRVDGAALPEFYGD